MKHVAFKMQLYPGVETEYKKRHDALWPELKTLLSDSGILNYHIFLDESTGTLFAHMEVNDQNTVAEIKHHPVMQRWWEYMSDLMETNADKSPVQTTLKEVFYFS
jgi:L-rhamnose mutarotase